MGNNYDSIEAILKLEELTKKRDYNLESIATKEVLVRDKIISPRDLVDIMYDNGVTDAYMQRYFGQGFLAMPAQVEELHLKRCENSGIPECTCIVSHDIPGVTVL